MERGIEEEGSNLSGVTSRCSWEQYSASNSDDSMNHTNPTVRVSTVNDESDRASLTSFGRLCDAIAVSV